MADRTVRWVIDATTAEHARGGIGVVVSGLLGALASSPRRDSVRVLLGPTSPAPEGVPVRRLGMAGNRPGRIIFQRVLPATLLDGLDRESRILFMDSYLPAAIPPWLARRSTVFVHDVLPLTHPQYFAARKDVWKRIAYRTLRRVRPDIVTSCEFTGGEITRELGVVPRLARFGCGQLSDDEADRRPSFGAREGFVLYVGNLDARKGLDTLADAVTLAASRVPGLRLAVVGDWRSPDGLAFRRRVVSAGNDRVRFLGRRSKAETLGLARRARALVYPTVAEGFGLPVLEGFATGTPVITTDLPAIRSWAGDHAAYVTPGNPQELADAILEGASDATSARLVDAYELSRGYRWSTFAGELLDHAR